MNREVGRKVRSDKKREVKPLIATEVKDAIYRISHITHTPVKDVCEFLVVYVANDRQSLDTLSRHFKRSINVNRTYYVGHIDAEPISKRLSGNREKVTTKFMRQDYEVICALAYAMDCTPTRATAILLTQAVRNVSAVNAYVREYLNDELTDSQMRDLRQVLSYVHRYNNDNYSWASVLSAIVGDVRPATRSLRELVSEFIREIKR